MGGVTCCQSTLLADKLVTVTSLEADVTSRSEHLFCGGSLLEWHPKGCEGSHPCHRHSGQEVEPHSRRPVAAERAPMPQMFCCPDSFCHQKTFRVLAYGDSLTAGFYAKGHRFSPYARVLAEELLPEVAADVWSCGLSGLKAQMLSSVVDATQVFDCSSRTGKGIRRILRESGPFDIVLIMAGTNDLAKSKKVEDVEPEPEAIVQAVRDLHSVCHEEGVPTISLSIPPSRAMSSQDPQWASYRTRWHEVNSLLKTWASGAEAVAEGVLAFVDMNLLIPFREGSELWETDGLHFSAAGSRHVGRSLARELAPLLGNLANQVQGEPLPQCFSTMLPHPAQHRAHRVLCFGDGLTAGARSCGRLFSPYAETLANTLRGMIRIDMAVHGFSGVTSKQLFCEMNTEEVADAIGRRGKGLCCILEEDGPFDLAILLVGSQDLQLAVDDPEDIAVCISGLHAACHMKNIPTLALAVPALEDTQCPDISYADRCRRMNKALAELLSTMDSEDAPALCSEAAAAQSPAVELSAPRRPSRSCSGGSNSMRSGGCAQFVDTMELLATAKGREGEMLELDGVHMSKVASERLGVALAPLVKRELLQRRKGSTSPFPSVALVGGA